MSETKGWAYVTELGPQRITAWEVKRQRDLLGGGPLGKTYWSQHRKGDRRKVKQMQRPPAKPFFAYMDDSTPHEGDGGESLTHVLFKNAIARLGKTQLRFPNGETHDIRITYAEMEKTVTLMVGYRVVDVYCKFESDGYLAKKWGGEVCFEVWHTHRAPPEKIIGLRDKRIPVVEVKVSEFFRYRYDGDTTNDEREEKHITYLAGRLEEFMAGKAISDPSSVEYLEEKVQIMSAQIARDAKLAAVRSDEIKMLGSEIGRLKENNAVLAEDNAGLVGHNASLTTKLVLLENMVAKNARAITRLGNDNESLMTENKTLRNDLKYRKILLTATGVAFAICLAWLLYISFIGGRAGKNSGLPSTANDQHGVSSDKLPERTSALPESYKNKTVKRKAQVKKINKNERPVKKKLSDSPAMSESSAD